jgi:hypothetical protein
MTLEEFQTIGRGMITEARVRFREQAMALCLTDAERDKAMRLEPAIGEVSPEEAVYALKLWLDEQRENSFGR